MTETDWSEGIELPQRKKSRGPLFWLLGCMGCGCLTVIVLVALGGFFVSRAMDPERQWPEIRQVIAFEGERPEQPQLLFRWPFFGPEQIQLQHTGRSLQGVLYPLETAAEVETMFDPSSPELSMATDFEPGTVTVQGREVRSLVYRYDAEKFPIPEWLASRADMPEGADLGRFLRVDLSFESGPHRVFDLAGAPGQELAGADVDGFLEEFDVWREP